LGITKKLPKKPEPDFSYISEPLRPLAVPVETLRNDPRNARVHPDRNIHAIRQSLRKFGQQKPIVVQDDGVTIITGHGTLQAAVLEGWSHVAVSVSDLNGRDATAYGLADNRTAETAEWDFEQVTKLIKELQAAEYDVEALGWADYELTPLLAADWSPAAIEDLTDGTAAKAPTAASGSSPDDSDDEDDPEATGNAPEASSGRPDLKYVPFTEDQHELVLSAVEKLKEHEGDMSISDGRALELICADWLAGK
jgi:hypothetical protein